MENYCASGSMLTCNCCLASCSHCGGFHEGSGVEDKIPASVIVGMVPMYRRQYDPKAGPSRPPLHPMTLCALCAQARLRATDSNGRIWYVVSTVNAGFEHNPEAI